MRTISLALLALTAAVGLNGCTMRIADLTVASSKNVNLNSGALTEGRRVTGSDSVPVILFPLGFPNMEEAIDRAIEKDKCAVGLSDVVIGQEAFAFIVGYQAINVEGNLLIDAAKPGCGGLATQNHRPQYNQAAQASSPSYSTQQQQLEQLSRESLSYEEYQRRYREIVGE
ncbi:hypothetical protein D9M68_317210 [compost metagenome]|uniref:Lipoprotein n=1 Tax=Pseudomonas jinjuensis TaxID=198616 RepID=A0A1H0DPY4_9PSED|nr:hypothetical protein [Pseudomonas jinjuensis]SDN72041.1 hypothetical protein SAMN05216193_104372 [Pseudomonas jinjuensis]